MANLYDFNFNDFVKDIKKLADVEEVEILTNDKYGWDVCLDGLDEREDETELANYIERHSKYADFIFDSLGTTGVIYLKMPCVRVKNIRETCDLKVVKQDGDSILIKDKNNDIKFWVDVYTDDDNYSEWEYNQMIFNTNKYEDALMELLQQDEDFWYLVDDIVQDLY